MLRMGCLHGGGSSSFRLCEQGMHLDCIKSGGFRTSSISSLVPVLPPLQCSPTSHRLPDPLLPLGLCTRTSLCPECSFLPFPLRPSSLRSQFRGHFLKEAFPHHSILHLSGDSLIKACLPTAPSVLRGRGLDPLLFTFT